MKTRTSLAVTMAAALAIATLGLAQVSRAASQAPTQQSSAPASQMPDQQSGAPVPQMMPDEQPGAPAAQMMPDQQSGAPAAQMMPDEQPGAPAAQSSAAADAQARLNKKQFENVKASVENGIATLTGTVDLYEYKVDAAKRVMRASGVTAVRNQIEVAGPKISDKELQASLQEKLTYDRVGYGNEFDAIGVKVENGMVTLSGHSHDYPNKDSALALAATMPGVKDVMDDIEVDPISPMDWGIRMAVARSVYSYPLLNKYAIDPAKPIRISVQNGNVALYGTVDSEADKDAAYLRASTVPNVFSVKNYLQVEGQPSQPSEKR